MTSENFNFLVGDPSNPYVPTRFVRVLENCPRFWLTPTVAPIHGRETQVRRILRDTDDKAEVPVFVDLPSSGQPPAHKFPVPGRYGSVEYVRYTADEVMLSIQAPHDSWLFSTERYAHSWRAYVDGTPVQLHKANFCFRALQVPAGKHTVAMRYEPWIYIPLTFISWFVIFCVLLVWGFSGLSPRIRTFGASESTGVMSVDERTRRHL
jgi:hypothetical protein